MNKPFFTNAFPSEKEGKLLDVPYFFVDEPRPAKVVNVDIIGPVARLRKD